MPYIQFELDAMKRVPDAARLAGVSEHHVGWGLTRLWAFCWDRKTDTVSAAHLAGFFGGNGEQVAHALETFGFAEIVGDLVRIRGAERYLRLSEQRSKAGTKTQQVLSKRRASAEQVLNGNAALTPITEHQSPIKNLDSKAAAGVPPVPQSKPKTLRVRKPKGVEPPALFDPMKIALVAEYELQRGEKYGFDPHKDPKAIKRIIELSGGDVDAAVERFRRGLCVVGWARCSWIHELARKWNDIGAKAQGPPKVVDFRKAPVRSEDIPKEKFAVTGDVTHEF